MPLIDRKFAANKLRYFAQCLLATASVLVVLVILDALTEAALIAALGASCFSAFTVPNAKSTRARYLIGGYVVGIVAGTLCFWLGQWGAPLLEGLPPGYPSVLFGALAVGLAILGMVATDTEHPPAAGVALGLVLGQWNWATVGVVLTGIVLLSAIKWLLRSVLINLV